MRKKEVLTFVFLLGLAVSCLVFGATSDPWDGTTWDVTAPDIDQPHGNTYKEIYDLRKGVAIRVNKEHETLATSSAGGVHKQGSARAFFQDAAPTTQVDGSAFDSGDLGLFWFDSNASPDNQFNVLTATTPTWTPVSTEIIAVLLASNRTFAGTLTVTGESTFNNHINLGAGDDLIGSSTSDIKFNTNKFTVAGATGNTLVAGTLDVQGNIDPTTYETTNGGFLDEDAMGSNAANKVASQQSIKAYIAAQIAAEVTLSAYATQDSEANSMLKAHAYLAATGGWASSYVASQNTKALKIYVGATDDPEGAGQLIQVAEDAEGSSYNCVSALVAEGEYFEVTYEGTNTPVIRWKSFGTLSKPVDQD